MNKALKLVVVLFLFLSLIQQPHAQQEKQYRLDGKLELLSSSDLNTPVVGNISDWNTTLILKVTIVNQNDFWILAPVSYTASLTQDDKPVCSQSSYTITVPECKLGLEVPKRQTTRYMPPRSNWSFYVPLQEYNEKLRQDRIGDWTLIFEGQVSTYSDGLKCFSKDGLVGRPMCEFDFSNEIKFIPLKFEVKTPEIKPDSAQTSQVLVPFFFGVLIAIVVLGLLFLLMVFFGIIPPGFDYILNHPKLAIISPVVLLAGFVVFGQAQLGVFIVGVMLTCLVTAWFNIFTKKDAT